MEDTIREVIAGLITGCLQVSLFNPVDRALYLHVVNKRSFLHRENWRSPYQGVGNAVLSKTVSNGLYYSMMDWYKRQISTYIFPTPDDSDDKFEENRGESRARHFAIQTLTGLAVGMNTSLVIQPLSAVKYMSWGIDDRSLTHMAKHMYQKGGITPFTHGMWMTVLRDSTFSVIYANLRPSIYAFVRNKEVHFKNQRGEKKIVDEKKHPMAVNVVEAKCLVCDFTLNAIVVACATIFSSPMNYIRNQQMQKMGDISAFAVMEQFLRSLKEQRGSSSGVVGLWKKFVFVQHRLCIGWGTARVAIGMASGQLMYDRLNAAMGGKKARKQEG